MDDRDDGMNPWFLPYLDAADAEMFPEGTDGNDSFDLMTTSPQEYGEEYGGEYGNGSTKAEMNSPGEHHHNQDCHHHHHQQQQQQQQQHVLASSPGSPPSAPPMALSLSPSTPAGQASLLLNAMAAQAQAQAGTSTAGSVTTANEQPESQISTIPSPGFDEHVTSVHSGWNSAVTTPVHIDMLDSRSISSSINTHNSGLSNSFHSVLSSTSNPSHHPSFQSTQPCGPAEEDAAAAVMFHAQQLPPGQQPWVDFPSQVSSSSSTHFASHAAPDTTMSAQGSQSSSAFVKTSQEMSQNNSMLANHSLPVIPDAASSSSPSASSSAFYSMMMKGNSDPFPAAAAAAAAATALPMHGLLQMGPLGMPGSSVQYHPHPQDPFRPFVPAGQYGQGVMWPCTPSSSAAGIAAGATDPVHNNSHNSAAGVTVAASPDDVTAAAGTLSHPSQIGYITPSGVSPDGALIFSSPNNTQLPNLCKIRGSGSRRPHGGGAGVWHGHAAAVSSVAPHEVRLQPTLEPTPDTACTSPAPTDDAYAHQHGQPPPQLFTVAASSTSGFPSASPPPTTTPTTTTTAGPGSTHAHPMPGHRHRLPSAPRGHGNGGGGWVGVDEFHPKNPKSAATTTTAATTTARITHGRQQREATGPYARAPLPPSKLAHFRTERNDQHMAADIHVRDGRGEDMAMAPSLAHANDYLMMGGGSMVSSRAAAAMFPPAQGGAGSRPGRGPGSGPRAVSMDTMDTMNTMAHLSFDEPRHDHFTAASSADGSSVGPPASQLDEDRPTTTTTTTAAAAAVAAAAAASAASTNTATAAAQEMQRQLEDRMRKDQFLLEHKRAGLTYKEIRKLGGFTEAESTLRGRHRTLTKPKAERVRKPVWSARDDRLLRDAVQQLARGRDVGPDSSVKISWKAVGDYIYEHGGSYHFGNTTCRKRWDTLTRGGE